MGKETVSQDKLRMVLDYLPCTPCLKMPSEEQRYLCTICNRLNRTVARKCLFAKEMMGHAVASAVIVGDKVYLTTGEWEKIKGYLAHPPAVDADKDTGKICLTRKQWDDILDEIESIFAASQSAGPEALAPMEPQEPFEVVPEIPSESGTVKVDEDIEVVYDQPKASGQFELVDEEMTFKEVQEKAAFEEVGEMVEEAGKGSAEAGKLKYATGVKVFLATANVDEEIAKWAEEHGAVVRSKIPIRVKQK